MSKILKLGTLRPKQALKNLNRLTGLDFQSWPESLVNQGDEPVQEDSEIEDRQDFPQRVSRQG
ncbi:MAG: hypothetical protein MI745_17175 [Pseudomonadales bacterium]|nr:hypothetical protein [Pseudomonadales bacterium]